MNDFKKYSELYHHGIKGQKWGVRRFQNEDGTLTPLGKQKLHDLNEEYAIHQHYKEEMEHNKKLMSGHLNDEEKEYLSDVQKKMLAYASKENSIFQKMYKFVSPLSEKMMKRSEEKIQNYLKEFKEDGVNLYRMEKMRPLYLSDGYVKRVFKQFDIKTK